MANNPSGYAACMMRTPQPEEAIRLTESIIEEAGLAGRVAAATTDDEQRKLALVNRHATDELVCEVRVNGEPLTASVSAEVLRGDSADACNDVAAPDRVVPKSVSLTFDSGSTKLPPHSITICKVS
ncbi:MAG: hypothetical protein ABIF82_02305 [Planctomycetota bacterium]